MPKGDYSKTKEFVIPLQGVVRNGQLAALLDHNGTEVGGIITSTTDLIGGIDISQLAASGMVAGRNGVYNLHSRNMQRWRAAVSKVRAGSSNAHLLVAADSTGRGANSSPSWVGGELTCMPRKLTQMLNSYFAAAASDSTFGDGGMGNANFDTYDTRIARGVWYSSTLKSAGGNDFASSGGAGAGFSFTPGGNWDTAEIYTAQYAYSNNGTMTPKIDGNAPTTGPTTINANAATALAKSVITAPSVGAHTVTINQDSRAGYVNALFGIRCYDSTAKKILVDNLGWGGSKPSDWVVNTPWPWDPCPMITALTPDLTIIEISINALFAGVDAVTWASQYQTMITAAKVTGDVIIALGTPTQTAAVSHAGLEKQYFAAGLALALANNVPFIDMRYNWLDWTTADALGYLQADKTHNTPAGYLDKAQTYFNALTGKF